MYVISILAIIIVTLLIINLPLVQYIYDLPSLIMLILICIPLLISAGLIKDFNNAFGIAFGRKKDAGLNELKRAAEALTLTIKTLMCGGILIFLMSMITILHTLSTPQSLGPKLSIAIISLIYAFIFSLLLLPLRSILNIRIIEHEAYDVRECENNDIKEYEDYDIKEPENNDIREYNDNDIKEPENNDIRKPENKD